MIFEFSFRNFKSYKSEATISFIANPINEFKETLLRAGKESLLPVCVLYGPNGGGKSNMLSAIWSLRNIVLSPLVQLTFMKKKNEFLTNISPEELEKNAFQQNSDADTFYKWDDTGERIPTEYSILFQVENDRYRYDLKIFKGAITEENLYIEDENGVADALFERDTEAVYLCDELKNIDVENMNDGLPLLSYIGIFKNIREIDNALRFFLNMQTVDFDMPTRDHTIFIKSIECDKKRILNVIQSMGIDISDIRVKYNENGKVDEIYTKHKLGGGIYKELKFSEESSGTRKIFSFLPVLLSGIDNGRFLVMDELDAKLHPVLLQKVIELFTNPSINTNGAQMLFTSHDITTMSSKVFRRDEIWFSAINGYNESVLYSLADFRKENGRKPRNDETYGKQYLEGKYGADPYLKRIVNWEVQD